MEKKSQPPKPRGRPAGSKNKKTRVAVNNPSESNGINMSLCSHMNVLQVPAGCDVIGAVYDFTNRHQLDGVSVTSTCGMVCNFTVYQPNKSSPYYKYTDAYTLLLLMGNFYGSSSSIRPPSFFSTRHVASVVCGEGFLHVGIIHGKLIAASNVILGISFINGTESIKLPLPLPPPPPRTLPVLQPFFDLNGGMRSPTAGLPSGAGSSRIPTAGLFSGTGSSMTATAGLPGFSSGAGRPMTATGGLLELSSGAGLSRTPTGGLLELSSGAGLSRTPTGGLLELSSGAGLSRTPIAGLFSGAGLSRTPTAGLFSGARLSRTPTAGLLGLSSGTGLSRTATAGPPGFSSGAGRPMTATAGLLELSSGAALSRTPTAGLLGLSSGTGLSRIATASPPGFSSGAGRPMTGYGVPTSLSSLSLFSGNPMSNNFSSTPDSKDSDGSIVRGSLG